MTHMITTLHYTLIGLTIVLPACMVALGQQIISTNLLDALNQQPTARQPLLRAFFLGMALNETSAILSGLVGIMLLLKNITPSLATVFAYAGIFAAVVIPSAFLGILSAQPIFATLLSIARQPFLQQKITTLMFITVSIMQTPAIFGLVMALLLSNQVTSALSLLDGIRIFASGCALGFGAVGPLIGLSLFSRTACTVVGTTQDGFNKIMSFTFLSQALIETPILFSLSLSLFLGLVAPNGTLLTAFAYCMSAVVMGLCTLGTGIASGITARAACYAIGKEPELATTISRTSLFAQTLIDTAAIYGLVIALFLVAGT